MQVATLLDRAKNHTGSDGLTAKALGVSANRVSDWRTRQRPCPAEVQDKLCVLGCLSDAEIAAHVVERAGMSRKATTAASVLAFIGSLAIAAAAFVGLLGGHSTAYAGSLKRDNV